MSGNMPVVSIDITFFWQMINFIVLLFIFNRYFRKPLAKIIKERKNKIEAEFFEVQKEKYTAEILRRQVEKELSDSKKTAVELIKNAERKAHDESEKILSEAKERREKILKTTEYEVSKIKEDAQKDLNIEVKKLATELAEKLIKEKIDVKQETSLIDNFITGVGEDE